MDINLELYRVFNAVVRLKSFSGAARELYISQPAVSQAIKQLEEACGTRLFVREKRGVTLTGGGEVLYGYIHSALNLIEAGEHRIAEMNTLSAGELRIGASDSVSKWYLLPAIKRFHETYPGVTLRITNRVSIETLDLLRDGKIDIGFVNMPISAQDVIFEKCRSVHDIFIAGEKFTELRGKKIPLAKLSEYPIIMLENASNSRRWVDRHFFSKGIALKPEVELGAHDLLLDYAGIGLGVACVIEEFSRQALNGGDMFRIEIEEPVPERSINACYLERIGLPVSARRFIDLVKEEIDGF